MLVKGEKVGGYVVGQKLGESSTGEVFQVRPIAGQTPYAMRIVRDPEPLMKRAFEQEVRRQKGVSHPNLAVLVEMLYVRGDMALVVQKVSGPTLEEWLTDNPVDLVTGRALFSEILSGVAQAHRRGLVHGDLRPDDVTMQSDGGRVRPVLRGFGIDRHVHGPDNRPTGSAAYRAPEMFLSLHRAGRASDLFSMGCLLYRMLCGQAPFPDSTPLEGEARSYTPPREHLHLSELPRSLEAAIEGCLETDPDSRIQDCETLLRVLEDEGMGDDEEGAAQASEVAMTDTLAPAPVGPSPVRLALIGAAVGALFAVLWVFVLDEKLNPPDEEPVAEVAGQDTADLRGAAPVEDEPEEPEEAAPSGSGVAAAPAAPKVKPAWVDFVKGDRDDRVCLQGATQCYKKGAVPPGDYPVWVESRKGSYSGGVVTLASEQMAKVQCSNMERSCWVVGTR